MEWWTLYMCFLYAKKEVVHMESDWHWLCEIYFYKKYFKLKKEGNYYELWRIWWTICATRIKRKIKWNWKRILKSEKWWIIFRTIWILFKTICWKNITIVLCGKLKQVCWRSKDFFKKRRFKSYWSTQNK